MERTQELIKAYSDVMASGFAAFNTGLQQNNAFATGMMNTNVKMVESGQEFVKSAFKYGEAVVEWSMDAAKGMAPKPQA